MTQNQTLYEYLHQYLTMHVADYSLTFQCTKIWRGLPKQIGKARTQLADDEMMIPKNPSEDINSIISSSSAINSVIPPGLQRLAFTPPRSSRQGLGQALTSLEFVCLSSCGLFIRKLLNISIQRYLTHNYILNCQTSSQRLQVQSGAEGILRCYHGLCLLKQ